MKLFLEDVRCFSGRHEIPVKPLTILVGENSAGKTTFLGMLASALNLRFPSNRYPFNTTPYDLGGFDTIATYKGGRYGRAESFGVGIFEEGSDKTTRYLYATYRDREGQPALARLVGDNKMGHLELEIADLRLTGKVILAADDKGSIEVPFSGALHSEEEISTPAIFRMVIESAKMKSVQTDQGEVRYVGQVLDLLQSLLVPRREKTAISLAPVRTKPRRTYDEVTDEFKPEGDHVPLVISRIWGHTDDKRAEQLHKTLMEFGSESGLFSDLDIRMLGKRPSSPFQIIVKIGGPFTNLPDVGYGVSQALPVVVESVLATKRNRVLLQQPEVHLHPRAQAALGTLFSKLVATQSKQFVIETHSDYLVDRIRQEIARGTLSNEAVSILFFNRQGADTAIHEIKLDKEGNLIDVPDSYRTFFLQEQASLLFRE